MRIFVIDEGGPKENVTEADVEMDDHARKSLTMAWHNSIDGILASSSVDKTIKVYDVNQGEASVSLDMDGTVTQMAWGPNGDVLGAMVKDKAELALVDPRDESSMLRVETGLAPRFTRMQWVSEENMMTFGYNA